MAPVEADVVVVGGGIVGLAAARAVLVERPGASVVVIEKESAVARHQTGHNSGVIHSGIYYRPGSEKARLVARGRALLEEFCADHAIARDYCGKVVVATTAREIVPLSQLAVRADAHRLEADRLTGDELRAIEPHAAGVAALHLPATGIVDFGQVADALAGEVAARGGEIRTSVAVRSISRSDRTGVPAVAVGTTRGAISARVVVNCAGLHSDRVAAMDAPRAPDDPRITPFRGEYHELRPGARDAVLALAREGYTWGDVSAVDLAEMARDPGLRRLARRHWRAGLGEVWRSLSTAAFVRALRRLVPEICAADLEPAPAGVRAQTLRPDGTLVEDFAFVERGPVLHVINAPSPAATASLAIGEQIAARLPHP